jgi:hypothetical protein
MSSVVFTVIRILVQRLSLDHTTDINFYVYIINTVYKIELHTYVCICDCVFKYFDFFNVFLLISIAHPII